MKNIMKNLVKSFLIVLFIILLAVFFQNKAEIYAHIGSFYLTKNNCIKAQKFYEKSYNLGNRNKDFREKYVNLLINSPLTIKAQEELVNIAEDGIKDSASESAKYFLFNLKREIHNKYPDNYIQQAPYNQKVVHWGKFPITYCFKQTKGVSQDILNAVNDAFDTWERVSSARIRFERVHRNADITVSFTNNKVLDVKLGQKYVIAYTYPEIVQDKLVRMDMTLNTINIDGEPFTQNQIYNTALHEIFHALGFMGHSFNKNDVMYMTRNNEEIVYDIKKEVSNADRLTLELFYKIKPDITNASEMKYDYIPYPVIGNSAEVNYAKADEAKSYIRKAPTIPSGYVDLAQTLINQKKYGQAIANLEKALRLSADDETKYLSLYNLAVAYYYEKSYELALFYVQKAGEIKDEESLRLLSAEICIKQNNIQKAEEEYVYLTKLKPDNPDYAIKLANIYIKNKRYIKARKILKTYLHRNPQDVRNPRFDSYRLLLLF